jgi:agmatine/peptidylarginine deiminase
MKRIITKFCYVLMGLVLTGTNIHAQKMLPKNINAKEIFWRNKHIEKKLLSHENNQNARPFSVDTILNLPTDARVPAQFEESQAIAITWAYNGAYTDSIGLPMDASEPDALISIKLAHAINLHAKVLIRVQRWSDSTLIKNIMSSYGFPLSNYAFYQQSINAWWDRDSGPISFYYSDKDSIGMIDMDYYTFQAIEDTFGNVVTDYNLINSFGRLSDDSIPKAIAKHFDYPVFKTSLNDEGGNLMFDGNGTAWSSDRARLANTNWVYLPLIDSFGNIIWVDSVNFVYAFDSSAKAYYTYPQLTSTGFDSLYKKSFNVQSMVEPEVFYCDGGTGHLDIYLKLIDENNLAIVDYTTATNHSDLATWNSNLIYIQSLLGANGQPLNLHLLQMPPTANGTTQIDCELDQRTYINGVFVNKAFIMPIMSNPNNPTIRDVDAINRMKQILKGYTIEPIDVSSMYGYGGALHCITMQIPAENPIFIKHNPTTGNQSLQANYPLNIFAKNKSGIQTAKIFFKKKNVTTWTELIMTSNAINNFTTNINGTSLALGDTIEYYIEALSNNGKKITKPMTGYEGGAYQFIITAPNNIETISSETNFILNAYPNPTKENITIPIALDGTQQVSISVTDITGKMIYYHDAKKQKGLHLIHLKKGDEIGKAGIYIIQVTIGKKINKVQKVVVE